MYVTGLVGLLIVVLLYCILNWPAICYGFYMEWIEDVLINWRLRLVFIRNCCWPRLTLAAACPDLISTPITVTDIRGRALYFSDWLPAESRCIRGIFRDHDYLADQLLTSLKKKNVAFSRFLFVMVETGDGCNTFCISLSYSLDYLD